MIQIIKFLCWSALALFGFLVISAIFFPSKVDVSDRAKEMGAGDWRYIALGFMEENTVEKSIRPLLKDPNSALFGAMRASTDGSEVAVCVNVNSRNSFGGMTGFKPFGGIFVANSFTPLLADSELVGGDPHRFIMRFCIDKQIMPY